MIPTLQDGDYVILRRERAQAYRTGDVVCIRRAGEPLLIKRLAKDAGDGFRLSGDGPASQPSIDLGIVTRREIEGRAVARITGATMQLIRREKISSSERAAE